jgi:tetratricopeptide (TPR) repeat protein
MVCLLAVLCMGQEQTPQEQAPQAPASQTPESQAPQAPASQTPESQAPQSDQPQSQVPQAPVPQRPVPQDPVPLAPGSQTQPAQKQTQRNQEANRVPITLESNETIFSVLAAVNACGYDQDLTISDATRSNVRAEMQRNLQGSADAQVALSAVCDFYQNHIASKDANRNLSQYISLALYLDGPPHFIPRLKAEELPPDAAAIAPFATLLEHFYEKAGLHSIWERHRNDYAAAMRRYHDPLAKMVLETELYLKQPPAEYLGRTFTIYLDFMGSPNETDARNYGSAYYVVVFPAPSASLAGTPEAALKMEQVRHTFLHYEMEPLAEKHFTSIKRLQPLLQSVKRSPLEDSFKNDISLLVTECLVRAIEIRTMGSKHTEEALRTQAVDDAVKQGYILTRYFYDAVVAFEKDPSGIRGAYGGFLNNVDLKKEEKAAEQVQFASAAAPELLRLSRPEERRILITAEKRLAAGDPKGAQELAQAALDKKIGDQGRALFILAEVAVANRNRDGAQDNFQKAIAASQDPTVVGWSHVYLGRILDMKEDREAALEEYRAALTAGGRLPEIKEAAERGLDRPYQPPAKPQPQ